MKVVIPDLISNSYFPAIAAVEMGFFKEEGLNAELELIYPVGKCYEALRDGKADFVGGSSHSAPTAFPEWNGVKFLGALAQHTYWFLIMRTDLNVARGDVSAVKGKRIGAAPWVEMGLRRLLIEAGIDIQRDAVTIAPVPGAIGEKANFGLMAAQALADGKIDGFWANGMGAEVALRAGTGTLVLDIRRGDGPKACFNYTMASLAASDALIAREPETAAAAVRAIVATQQALKADLSLATKAGRALFPAAEAQLIAGIVRRDLPYYDPSISREFVAGMNQFARDVGILDRDVAYESVVASLHA
jgi:ABC-type nitrate/sulfonate/bicarbonate transport system substrate-binding protein